jgi:hypothetical protein
MAAAEEQTGADAGACRARPRHGAGAHRPGARLTARALRPTHVATGKRDRERERAPNPFFERATSEIAASGRALSHKHTRGALCRCWWG